MRAITLLLSIFLLSGLSSTAQDPNNWTFKGAKSDIKIYQQRTPGLLHIKLATSIKAPLSGIVAMFSDVSTYPVWGYKITEARLLRRVSNFEMYYYAKYDFPWPLDDRDIILHSKLEQHPVTKVISIVNTPMGDYLPEKKGLHRIRNTSTQWLFVPSANGWVYTEQQISTDSAEGVPDWLVKLTADTGPHETAKGVRQLLSTERFQQAKLPYIKD